jgi:hypothetical protein
MGKDSTPVRFQEPVYPASRSNMHHDFLIVRPLRSKNAAARYGSKTVPRSSVTLTPTERLV